MGQGRGGEGMEREKRRGLFGVVWLKRFGVVGGETFFFFFLERKRKAVSSSKVAIKCV